MSYTTRCTATERKVFNRMILTGIRGSVKDVRCSEPALGTLDERLDILIRRLDLRPRPVRLTKAERAALLHEYADEKSEGAA